MNRTGLFLQRLGALFCVGLGSYYVYALLQLRGFWDRVPAWDQASHGLDAVHFAMAFERLNPLLFLEQLNHSALWPPVIPLIQSVPLLIFGDSFGLVRCTILVFAGLSLAGVYLVGVKLHRTWGGLIGLLAAVMLFISPGYAEYSIQMMLEVPGVLFSLPVLYYYFEFKNTGSDRAWRNTVIATTVLFFCKFNYAILSSVPILLYEVFTNPKFREPIVLAAKEQAYSIRWRSKFLYFAIFYIAFLLSIPIVGGYNFEWQGRVVQIQRAWGNPVYILVFLTLIHALLFWRQRFKTMLRQFWNAPEPYQSFNRFFVFPFALWMAYPQFFKTFFIFLFSESTRKQSLISQETLTFYPGMFVNFFSAHPALGIGIAIGILLLPFLWRRLDGKGRYLVIASYLGMALVMSHPNYQERYLITTLPMIYLGSGLAFVRILEILLGKTEAAWKDWCLRSVRYATALGLVGLAVVYAPSAEKSQRSLDRWTFNPSVLTIFAEMCHVSAKYPRNAMLGFAGQFSPAGVAWECYRHYPDGKRSQWPSTIRGLGFHGISDAERVLAAKSIDQIMLLDIDRYGLQNIKFRESDLAHQFQSELPKSPYYRFERMLYEEDGDPIAVSLYVRNQSDEHHSRGRAKTRVQ